MMLVKLVDEKKPAYAGFDVTMFQSNQSIFQA